MQPAASSGAAACERWCSRLRAGVQPPQRLVLILYGNGQCFRVPGYHDNCWGVLNIYIYIFFFFFESFWSPGVPKIISIYNRKRAFHQESDQEKKSFVDWTKLNIFKMFNSNLRFPLPSFFFLNLTFLVETVFSFLFFFSWSLSWSRACFLVFLLFCFLL